MHIGSICPMDVAESSLLQMTTLHCSEEEGEGEELRMPLKWWSQRWWRERLNSCHAGKKAWHQNRQAPSVLTALECRCSSNIQHNYPYVSWLSLHSLNYQEQTQVALKVCPLVPQLTERLFLKFLLLKKKYWRQTWCNYWWVNLKWRFKAFWQTRKVSIKESQKTKPNHPGIWMMCCEQHI